MDKKGMANESINKAGGLSTEQIQSQVEFIYHCAPVALCVLDSQLRYVHLNQCLAEMNGLPIEEHLGRTPSEVVPNLAEQSEQAMRKILETGEPLLNLEFCGETPAQPGVIRYWDTKWLPIKNEQGEVIGISIVAEDITERKQAEEILKYHKQKLTEMVEEKTREMEKNNQKLRIANEQIYKAFNAIPFFTAIMTADGERVMNTNEELSKIPEFKNAMQPEFTDKIYWEILGEREELFAKIRSEHVVKNFAANVIDMSGKKRSMLFSGVRIFWQGQEYIMVVANDITELKHYQQELANVDRLRLIGTTAAGIAHEIRNPLTTVKGFLQIFKERESYASDREHLDLMIEELDRANKIITEFLSLAKNKPGNLKCQNLNDSIRKFLPLLEADAVKNDAFIKLELDQIPDLMLDEDEMRQLILNLVQNGIEAMPAGGFITIKTYQESNKVIMAVQDQGEGISPEAADKIDIPFFTTKNYGTGLGLPICYNIAYRNHAKIKFETSPQGTVFKVIFSQLPV